MCENRVLQNDVVQDVTSSSKLPAVVDDNAQESVEQVVSSRTYADQGHKIHFPHYAPITNRRNVHEYKKLHKALGDKDDPYLERQFHEFLNGRLHHYVRSRRETFFVGPVDNNLIAHPTDDMDTDSEEVSHELAGANGARNLDQ